MISCLVAAGAAAGRRHLKNLSNRRITDTTNILYHLYPAGGAKRPLRGKGRGGLVPPLPLPRLSPPQGNERANATHGRGSEAPAQRQNGCELRATGGTRPDRLGGVNSVKVGGGLVPPLTFTELVKLRARPSVPPRSPCARPLNIRA